MMLPERKVHSLLLILILGFLIYGVLICNVSWQGMKIKIKLNTKAEVDNLVSIISKLTQINNSSSYMTMLRNTLTNIPNNISLSPDLINKSEDYLDTTELPAAARITYSENWHGYRLPVITGDVLGRLGNVMGEYASLYALQQLYNITVFIVPEMRRSLPFPFLSLPDIPGKYNETEWKIIGHNPTPFWNFAPMELAAAGLFGPHCFINKDNTHATQKFHKFRKELIQEYSYHSIIITKVQQFLKSVADKRSIAGHPDIVFVGFHIRRTDYLRHARWYGGKMEKDPYYYRAMDYYRNKFPGSVVFIAASDDRKYLKEKIGHLSDVFIYPGESREMDMAVLTSCNHSIITYGSYGFWTGFLAGGEVVYPDGNFSRRYFFCRKFYEKIGLAHFTPLPSH